MKALVLNSFGSAPVLQTVDKPVPHAGQVLIKVKASGLNPLDVKIMTGQAGHAQAKLPAILGVDVSGIVAAVGEGVSNVKPGDEVYGMAGGVGNNPGSQAEYMTVDARLLALKPTNLSFHEAAAVPLIFITAWEGLVDRVNVQQGQRVLVHGGAGGVGHIAVQIAKARGAEVFATVRKPQFDQIKRYGAVPIDYTATTVEEYVNEYTGGKGFDVVMDNVGGTTLDDSFNGVKQYGHVVSIIGRGTHSLAPLALRGATYSTVFTLIPLLFDNGRAHHGEILQQATKLIEAGLVKPDVSPAVYSLETATAAYEELKGKTGKGKVVIDVN
ncbi:MULTISPECIES: zinc-dependent alcohol dehydrogenase family protein [Niastella]|uniref:Zinc-dependent alcohol dehydrogenase family protein n=1 Tax=Niastella soli TaxID=2821487 RepID=A0ABS3Z1C1_9BACT|nr:zinc-dependent alcohol dehydrogenase family protein [Niastella soli]MBO9203904.1 zinc-dependent alcohol dehydrogenase family protein [Niastella soli]